MLYLKKTQTRGCEVPERVRALFKRERIKRDWDHLEASRRIGMHPRAFQQMEDGTGNVRNRYETVQLWAGLFDYSIEIRVTKKPVAATF